MITVTKEGAETSRHRATNVEVVLPDSPSDHRHMESRISHVEAGLKHVTQRLDEVSEDVRDIRQRVDGLASGLTTLNGKVDSLKQVVDTRIGALERHMTTELAHTREVFHTKLTAVDASHCGKFDSVDTRFDSVDTRFDAMDARFDAMDAKFSAALHAMDAKFSAAFDAMDTKFSRALDAADAKSSAKFDHIVQLLERHPTKVQLLVTAGAFLSVVLAAVLAFTEALLRAANHPLSADVIKAIRGD
jgi:chromosome segregation ATPase